MLAHRPFVGRQDLGRGLLPEVRLQKRKVAAAAVANVPADQIERGLFQRPDRLGQVELLGPRVGVDEVPQRVLLGPLDLPVPLDGLAIPLAKRVVEGVAVQVPVAQERQLVVGVVPFRRQIDAGHVADLPDRDHDVVEVAVLLEQLEGLFSIEVLAREMPGRLKKRDDLDGVEPPVAHLARELVDVFRVPAAPQRRLAVVVHQIPVVSHDVVHDGVNQRHGPVAPGLLRHDLGKDRIREEMPDDLVAAGGRLPDPVGVACRLPSAFVGHLIAGAVERAGGKARHRRDLGEPLHRLEGLVAVA